MIVCSQCQSENPATHRFCQQCGAALKLWRAIVQVGQPSAVFKLNGPLAASQPESDASAASVFSASNGTELTLQKGSYLDAAQRYRLLDDLTLSAGAGEVLLTDTCPDQSLPLSQRFNDENTLTPLATGEWGLNELSDLIPMTAYPYLKLQERFFPAIPELQAAWVTPGYTILLIEDRSELTQLFEAWTAAGLNDIQQVHCLYAMVELWDVLAEVNGQGSLLKLNNLCLDEDQIFCLKQIDPVAGGRSLMDLGLLWQSLLSAAPQCLPALQELNAQIIAGDLDSVRPIKERLVEIADELHPNDIDDPDANDLTSGDVDLAFSPPDALEALALPEPDNAADEEPLDMPTMVLPMKLIGLEEAGLTHVGQQRDHNEDAYFIQSELRKQDSPNGQKLEAHCLYILCDGMGGHAGGEIASSLAVSTLQTYFAQNWQQALPTEDQIKEAIHQANQAIFDRNESEARTGAARMGTTLVLMLLSNTQAVVAHVGDSRLYRYTRRLGLHQLTVDHEVGQREIQRGVEPAIAYARPDAYQLTQALGPRDNSELEPSVTFLNFTEDTLLLLCSDGLSDHDLLETNCQSHIDPLLRGPKHTEEGVSDLIDLANEVNGHDNITAVAVKLRVKPNLEQMQMG
ncbi:MAG: serine/threonine phosphatase [Cyanobacteria bacterium J06627_15]